MNLTHHSVASLLLAGVLLAQSANGQDAEALAKAAQNPLATMVTLPFQANWNSGVGPDERVFFNLNIQPVVPIPGEK